MCWWWGHLAGRGRSWTCWVSIRGDPRPMACQEGLPRLQGVSTAVPVVHAGAARLLCEGQRKQLPPMH